MGRSEALRGLYKQPLCFPQIQQKGYDQLKLSQCCIKQMAASIRARGMYNAQLQTLDERQAQSS